MSQYTWAACPEPVQTEVDTLVETLAQMLNSNLVGIYLHGSLAMGCFNPRRSDIDVLVVTFVGLTVETKRDVVQFLLARSLQPAPIEISFLVLQQIHPFTQPLPYDLHYSESWRERYTRALVDGTWRTWNDEQQYDNDLAAHITVTRARGICLCGVSVEEVLPAVPPALYVASIVVDFEDANSERQRMPVYFVLNACRVLAYLREGHIYSKDEGGMWGLQTLPSVYRRVVEQALNIYRSEQAETPFDESVLTQFSSFVEQQIHPT